MQGFRTYNHPIRMLLLHSGSNDLKECEMKVNTAVDNYCVKNASLTNFENAKRKYEAHGYKLPNVVFWNVQSRNRQQPVTMNEQGVALVSGCTPKLFSMVASGNIDPYSFMMEIVGSERYEKIVA